MSKTYPFPILVAVVIAGCVSQSQAPTPTPAMLTSITPTTTIPAEVSSTVHIWGLQSTAMDTRDVEFTALSDAYNQVADGKTTTFHHIWNGSNADPDGIHYYDMLGESTDPSCTSQTVALRVVVLTNGVKTGETIEAPFRCGMNALVTIIGGHYRDSQTHETFEKRLSISIQVLQNVACRTRGAWPVSTADSKECQPPFDPNKAPSLTIQTDDTTDRFTIISAGRGAGWERLAASTPTPGICVSGNQPTGPCPRGMTDAFAAGHQIHLSSSLTALTSEARLINAGDFLEFCSDQQPAKDVSITLMDTRASPPTQIGVYTLTSLTACSE